MKKLFAIAGLALLFMTQPVISHPMAQSKVGIYVAKSAWRLNLQLPNDRLEAAIQLAGLQEKGSSEPLKADVVSDYVKTRIIMHAEKTPSSIWEVKIDQVSSPTADNTFWKVNVVLTPPENTNQDKVNLNYDVIVKDIFTHKVNIWLVEDLALNVKKESPKALGYVRDNRRSLLIDRTMTAKAQKNNN